MTLARLGRANWHRLAAVATAPLLLGTLLGVVAAPHSAGAALVEPVVAASTDRAGQAWTVSSDGGVEGLNGAKVLRAATPGRGRAVGVAARPGGDGYWVASAAGSVAAYGKARVLTQTGGPKRLGDVVAIVANPAGGGYWLASRSGQVEAFGAARVYGQTSKAPITEPVVAMAARPNGTGYWLVERDGAVVSFGAARVYDLTAGTAVPAPAVGIASTPSGLGYWVASAAGPVAGFGAAGGADLSGDGSSRTVAIVAAASSTAFATVSETGAVRSGLPSLRKRKAPGTGSGTPPGPNSPPTAGNSTTTSPTTSAPQGSTATPPSGVAMPATAPTGYEQIMYDDFDGGAVDPAKWSTFSGGDGANGTWQPANVGESGAQLTLSDSLTTAGWGVAGVATQPALDQTYGEYLANVKFAQGDGISSDLLLWPTDGNASEGYIDFAQASAGATDELTAYIALDDGAAPVEATTPADLGTWNTVGVVWSAGVIELLLNGTIWKTITSPDVPSTSLGLQMKTQDWACSNAGGSCVDSLTPSETSTNVDWVVSYTPAPLQTVAIPAGTPDSSVPGGLAMPSASPAGFSEDFDDDFDEGALDSSKWYPYSGGLPSDPSQDWSPSNDVVANGMLDLEGYQEPNSAQWMTGGLSSFEGLNQTYGMYLVRFKITQGAVPFVVLLWPEDNQDTNEVDFAEDFGGQRQELFATVHEDGNETVHALSVDLTQWQTLGVIWTPGEIQYVLNGEVWATVTGPEVPSIPMALDLQTTTWNCSNSLGEECPQAGASEVNMDVAWVTAYAWDGGTASVVPGPGERAETRDAATSRAMAASYEGRRH